MIGLLRVPVGTGVDLACVALGDSCVALGDSDKSKPVETMKYGVELH